MVLVVAQPSLFLIDGLLKPSQHLVFLIQQLLSIPAVVHNHALLLLD